MRQHSRKTATAASTVVGLLLATGLPLGCGLLLATGLLVAPVAAQSGAQIQPPDARVAAATEAPLTTAAQVLEGLPPALSSGLQALVDGAVQDSLPLAPLRAKALEGVAKGVPVERIAMAIEGLATDLRVTRTQLRARLTQTPLLPGEVTSANMAMKEGVPAEQLATLWEARPAGGTSLEIPLAVTAELVRRGVGSSEAVAAMEHIVRTGTPAATAAQLPGRMDGLMRGAAGAEGVEGALSRALRSLGVPDPGQPIPGRGTGPGTDTGRRRGGS